LSGFGEIMIVEGREKVYSHSVIRRLIMESFENNFLWLKFLYLRNLLS